MIADLVAVLAALCWAAANTCIARGSTRGGDNGAFLSICLTVLMAGAFWLFRLDITRLPHLNLTGILWFSIAGALTIFFGRVFFHSSVQHLGAIRSASVKRLVPFFTVALGITWLGETLQPAVAAGMLLIFSGFILLVVESRRKASGASAPHPSQLPVGSATSPWLSAGIVYGVVSALAYASGNVSRKFGLDVLPDPAFGAMLGALVGVLLFLAAAARLQSYRVAVISAVTVFNPWLLGAGVLASAGQLLYFTAIDQSTLSRATLIVSIDVFLTILFSVVFFRARESISAYAVGAAALGFVGTAVIMLN
jgi:drug/metabolite transporter (DMT)-like permease